MTDCLDHVVLKEFQVRLVPGDCQANKVIKGLLGLGVLRVTVSVIFFHVVK